VGDLKQAGRTKKVGTGKKKKKVATQAARGRCVQRGEGTMISTTMGQK